ncbi:MAG: heme exporter protein CcmB [Actinomycetota bacterium]|nr:heme exporter protein CcmB [Actinomycetota bacterium]
MNGTRAGSSFISKTAALTRKDLQIEARGRSTLPPMVAFSVAVLLLLAFSIAGTTTRADATVGGGELRLADVLAGFLWVTVLFAGLIGFGRSFEVEREEGALDVLLLAPLDRSGLFASKALANLAYILLVQLILIPAAGFLFELRIGNHWPALLLVVALVDIGFVAIGTLFAALAASTSSRELMLPILALPALVPVFIAAVELTSDLFLGRGLDEVASRGWFGILIAFAVAFTTVGALAFEYVVE